MIRFLYLLSGFLGQFQLLFDYNSSFTITHLDTFFLSPPDFLLDIIKRSLFENIFVDPVWSYNFFCCLQIVWVDRLSMGGFIAHCRLFFYFNSNVRNQFQTVLAFFPTSFQFFNDGKSLGRFRMLK